jgi:hypothetical protein
VERAAAPRRRRVVQGPACRHQGQPVRIDHARHPGPAQVGVEGDLRSWFCEFIYRPTLKNGLLSTRSNSRNLSKICLSFLDKILSWLWNSWIQLGKFREINLSFCLNFSLRHGFYRDFIEEKLSLSEKRHRVLLTCQHGLM